ncbi:F-box only protein 25 [Nymphon striatum]|nr:F-box only protein 25 [Nymphon striatum]
MPFIGQDWRSPGELWIKTEIGWEKKKIFDFLNKPEDSRLELHEQCHKVNALKEVTNNFNKLGSCQPHCPITIKCTREVAGFNIMSEVFKMLDFQNAVRDVRRFKYMHKVLHLLINQNLNKLGGNATKVMFMMLEELAFYVSNSQQNIHILLTLLDDLKKVLCTYRIWGNPLGSTQLWDHHQETLDRITGFAENIKIKQPEEDGSKRLTDMPEEVVREILLRLSDHKDLQTCGQAYAVMQGLIEEQHIWRELCKFHFTEQQLKHILDQENSPRKWQQIYHKLRRKFGMREDYAETLYLCRQCRCLFWKSFGHPCIELESGDSEVEDSPSEDERENSTTPSSDEMEKVGSLHVPIPPEVFLKFFSL